MTMDKIEEALEYPKRHLSECPYPRVPVVCVCEQVSRERLVDEVRRLRALVPKSRSEYRRIEAQGGNALELAMARIKELEAALSSIAEEANKRAEEQYPQGWTLKILEANKRAEAAESALAAMTAERNRWHGEFQKETLERSKVIEEYANFRKHAALDVEAAYGAAFKATAALSARTATIYHNWHEEGGGMIVPTGYGFALYEVPQYGGEPRFSGHYDTIEKAKSEAEKWT